MLLLKIDYGFTFKEAKKEWFIISNEKCDWNNKLILLVDDKFITKTHLIQPGFTYPIFC